MTAALLAIDPGLDCTGWALYDLTGVVRPLWLVDAGKRFRCLGRWTTGTSQSDDDRMASLVRDFRELVMRTDGPEHLDSVRVVAIEAPPRPGLYQRNAEWGAIAMAQGVAYANALPALYLGATVALGLTAFYVPASRTPKAERWAQYRPFLSIKGRTNEDERDAAIIGIQVLTDSRRRWAASPTGGAAA